MVNRYNKTLDEVMGQALKVSTKLKVIKFTLNVFQK